MRPASSSYWKLNAIGEYEWTGPMEPEFDEAYPLHHPEPFQTPYVISDTRTILMHQYNTVQQKLQELVESLRSLQAQIGFTPDEQARCHYSPPTVLATPGEEEASSATGDTEDFPP